MQATISRNAFFYGLTESLAETTFPAIFTAARWGVLTWDVLTSTEARQTYKWVGSMAIALGQLVFWSAVWCYAKAAVLAERHVQASITPVAVTEAVEADPFSPDANPHHAAVSAVMVAPVATLVIPVSPTPATLTSAELRRQCHAAGIKWRNAHGASKHLSKAEMIAALA
jgi:hypothetical protein